MADLIRPDVSSGLIKGEMKMSKCSIIEKEHMKKEVPKFNVGDAVKVFVKIMEEDNKTRLQAFEGVIISKKGSGVSESFTVRRISYGEGVERTFPLHSPSVDRIEVVKPGKVKRAKLYYIRKKIGKKVDALL